MKTEGELRAWRPELPGWSDDILPFYVSILHELPNPCCVVEIGSAHCRSAIFLASKLVELGHGSNSKIFMIDDWGGAWFADCLPSLVKHATPRELELLRPLRATSAQAAQMFGAEEMSGRLSPHMVFIDGDHSRVGCADDLSLWGPRVNSNGILAGHDYDRTKHPGVVEAVDTFAKANNVQVRRPMHSVWRLR